MKTYPIKREDFTLHAFEIENTYISMSAIKKILKSVSGVTSIKRQLFSDDRLVFKYNNEDWVVNEPWGDNSRYWIGPKNVENHTLDVTPINEAFNKYESPLIKLWNVFSNANNS
jgi:hypothetical protein